MFKKPGELPIPSIAQRDRGAIEIGRIWAAKGDQRVSRNVTIWPDPVY